MVKTACLILAAGEASRFGSPKQLAEIAGKSLLSWAILHAQTAGFSPILVVSGAHRAAVEQQLPDSVAQLHHPDWAKGMPSTIRVGLAELLQSADWTHCCILPADMPYFDAYWLKIYQAMFTARPNRPLSAQAIEAGSTLLDTTVLAGWREAVARAGTRCRGKGHFVAQDEGILANQLSHRPAFIPPLLRSLQDCSAVASTAAYPVLVATLYPKEPTNGEGVEPTAEPGLPLLLNRMLAEAVIALPAEQSLRRFWLRQAGLLCFPAGPHTQDIDRVEDI